MNPPSRVQLCGRPEPSGKEKKITRGAKISASSASAEEKPSEDAVLPRALSTLTVLRVRMEKDEEDEEDEALCRYCFDGSDEGDLLKDICACSGGQRWVHLHCLRRWQRMVMVSQPTHPAFYEDDVRYHKCNVCAAEFNIPPPTRHELMQSFTGAEIAALISEGCVIGSHRVFSDELERQMETMHPIQRLMTGYPHWIKGVYLIVDVREDNGRISLPVRTDASLDRVRQRFQAEAERSGYDGISLEVGGKKHTILAGVGSFEEVKDGDVEGIKATLAALKAPAMLVLASETEPDCGEDSVTAVNMCRPVQLPPAAAQHLDALNERSNGADSDLSTGIPDMMEWMEKFEDTEQFGSLDEAKNALRLEMHLAQYRATMDVMKKYPGVRRVKVEHFIGGPCESDDIMWCVVPGGMKRGWTVVSRTLDSSEDESDESVKRAKSNVSTLVSAMMLAHTRAVRRDDAQGDVCGGQTVRLRNLQARADLNGEVGLALRYDSESGRWMIRLRNGEGKSVKPDNLEAMDGEGGRVFAFWGDARWSRAQLLGEIARGHWGLCRAGVGDITTSTAERWESLETSGRMAFAPVTEMTEDFMKNAHREMQVFRPSAAAAEGEDEGVQRDHSED